MAGTLFTKVPHFLDEKGELPVDLSGPGKKIQDVLDELCDGLSALLEFYLDRENDTDAGEDN